MLSCRVYATILATSAALGASLVGSAPASAQSIVVSSSSRSTGPSLSLVGLSLLGGGVATAAPGIVILAACKEGNSCHSDATDAIGWLLAGPGIPPILVGLFLIWLDKPHSRGSLYNVPQAPPTSTFRITASPLPSSGGMIGASYSF